jgi:DNA-binding transcriptional ArsR family regulator
MPPRTSPRIDLVAQALADGTRRELLQLVHSDEQPAGELAARFPQMSRPAVSQHLRVLQDAGLVTVRPDGNRRLYRARPEGLTEMWQYVDAMWSSKLARLKEVAEDTERRKRSARPERGRKR